MPRLPLLALFRGSDGRSIARGLIVLVLANVLIGGLHGGAMARAAAVEAPAVCTLAGGHGEPANPATDPDYRDSCLIASLCSVANVVPPSSPVLSDVPSFAGPVLVPQAVHHVTLHPLDGPASPRGPPSPRLIPI